MIAKGNSEVGSIYKGSTVIDKVYKGDTLIYERVSVPYTVRGIDGYWDFIDLADDYVGIIPNQNGTLVGEIYRHYANAAATPAYGIKDETLYSNMSKYMGGNGVYDYMKIYMSSTSSFYRKYPYTVEIYGKVNGTGTNNLIMSTRINVANVTGSAAGTDVYHNSTTQIKTRGSVGQGANTIATETIDLSQYHHYVIEVNSSLVKIYIDGVLQGSGAKKNNTISSTAGWLVPTYKGELKAIRVYNVLLTDAEVTKNYNDMITKYADS